MAGEVRAVQVKRRNADAKVLVQIEQKNRMVVLHFGPRDKQKSLSGSDPIQLLSEEFVERLPVDFNLEFTRLLSHTIGKHVKSLPSSADFDAVRGLFIKDVEFNSKRHLLGKLRRSGKAMPAKTLDIVLEQLIDENKIHVDGKSLIWIDATHNKKLLATLKRSVAF